MPGVAKGIVLCENWSIASWYEILTMFVDASPKLKKRLIAEEFASHMGLEPGLTVFFDVSTFQAREALRAKCGSKAPDDIIYYDRMRSFILGELAKLPTEEVVIIPAHGPQEEVNAHFLQAMRPYF